MAEPPPERPESSAQQKDRHLEAYRGSLHCSLVCGSSEAIRIALGYHHSEREERREGRRENVRNELKIRHPQSNPGLG